MASRLPAGAPVTMTLMHTLSFQNRHGSLSVALPPMERGVHSLTLILWQQIIQRHGGVITSALNISCLAKVTDGFTQGHIVRVVRSVLTDRRLRQQQQKPLIAMEFMGALSTMDPIYQEEEDSFKNWYAKTPMGKKRALAMMGGNTGTAKDKGKKKGKKEKKEKKKKK
ncbi:IQ and AAA domain-containing protein 1 [Myotis davidii]|uniref:IQ and AAA domain-containing protein 1 n=1 Tax=Myotis davidii TaxID=225400 RepID=L5M4J3_MYODS|nr:IQ and AAA domain-containing protein 1 [Myotis davidii]